jgi:peptidyl-prolyl cis-trans isomerase SurA
MRWTCYAAGMALAALLSTTALAQEAAPAATAPAEPAAQPAPPEQQYQPLSEGVAAVVNDDVISTYDVLPAHALLMVTSGVQPTQENLPQLQAEALRSLVDERLQMQELRASRRRRRSRPTPSSTKRSADIARGNNTKARSCSTAWPPRVSARDLPLAAARPDLVEQLDQRPLRQPCCASATTR